MGMDIEAKAYLIEDDGLVFIADEDILGDWGKHYALDNFMRKRWELRGGNPKNFGDTDFILNREDIVALKEALPLHDEGNKYPEWWDEQDKNFVESALYIMEHNDPDKIRITYHVYY